MTFEYFYGRESDLFSFIRVPKALFKEERFKRLSAESKLLYGLLLDRMCLSAENGWLDEKNRVYIVFTIEEVQDELNCGSKKAVAIMKELEECGLIEKKRQGLSKPNLIYVKNFTSGPPDGKFKNCQNDNSGDVEKKTQELSKAQSNNTDLNNTDFSDTESVQFCSNKPIRVYREEVPVPEQKRTDQMDEIHQYQQLIESNIEIEILKERYPYQRELIEQIAALILDVVVSKCSEYLIGREKKPAAIVKSQFLKLNACHIEYVIDRLEKNSTHITNMRQYLLATLYNAPLTIDAHYGAMYNHDKARGLV